MNTSITELFDAVNGKKIMVIGDVMVDSYYSGTVDRISPEAPVPIVRVHEKDDRLGGAANVALNLKALGAQPIICAAIGNDVKGKIFLSLMEKRDLSMDGILVLENRPTTVKTRIISDGQQMMRVDEESTDFIDAEEENQMISKFESLITEHNMEAV
ncbi:MAG: rfaE bifunctional protein kinase chain/domain, partial [Flavobacteriales bacterium]